ncbi:MAG: cysteine desulfurase [Bacillales bacterium]|jgi:cysteine desulfurase|nr:cysteine desulfurase [Bacillales bacterium]
MVYLDYAATSPLDPEVLAIYNEMSLKHFANPSSLHKLGRASFALLQESRNIIAKTLNVKPEEIIFTASATEANNLGIKGLLPSKKKEIISTKIDHLSIYNTLLKLEGYIIKYVNVKEDGLIDLEHLKTLLNDNTLMLVTSLVNNELGTVQLQDELYKLCHTNNTYLFLDGVQALGKIRISNNYDLLSLSSHKIYGLKGVGCLINKTSKLLNPLIFGGGQERNQRSGTENFIANYCFAQSIRIAFDHFVERKNYVSKLYALLENNLKDNPFLHLNSFNSSNYIFNFSLLKHKGEVIFNYLNSKGYYLSTTSACSSYSKSFSRPVYETTKSEHLANNSIRVSLSHLTSEEDIKGFIETLLQSLKEVRTI